MKRCWLALAVASLLGTTPTLTPLSAQSTGVAPEHAGLAKHKPAPFDVIEATIPEIQHAFRTRRLTSEQLVETYLARIDAYDDAGPGVNAFIHVSRTAEIEARWLDLLRRFGFGRGPLYGVPVLLKDNIDTFNMPTTAGSVALEGSVPPDDAFITRKLRQAGAIILGKATLTEYANFLTTGMPAGYSSLGNYGFNPYDPRRDPREQTGDGRPALNTGGSSSGTGTAANFWAANVGTETSGSILSPSNQNMLAAVKPTVGRVSRYGVIPITADQDTAGPMAKFVADAAILLGALESASPDPNDAATSRCTPPPNRDYTPHLKADGLKAARIGIPRAFYYNPVTPPGAKEPRGGLNADQTKVMTEAIEILTKQGAVIVDPADIPSVVDTDAKNNFLTWNTCSGVDNARGKDEAMRQSVLELFPILRDRLAQRSGTLSGGEQQMLAMARALCLDPKVLLLDEPTEGLMPSMIARIREAVTALRLRGVSTILVEQRIDAVLPVADRVSFIENGRTQETVDVGILRADPDIVHRYVGVGV